MDGFTTTVVAVFVPPEEFLQWERYFLVMSSSLCLVLRCIRYCSTRSKQSTHSLGVDSAGTCRVCPHLFPTFLHVFNLAFPPSFVPVLIRPNYCVLAWGLVSPGDSYWGLVSPGDSESMHGPTFEPFRRDIPGETASGDRPEVRGYLEYLTQW